MKRTLFVAALVIGFAAVANAASITLASDKTTYIVGETISLTSLADPTTGSDTGFYARVEFDGAKADAAGGTGQEMPATSSFGASLFSAGPQNSSAAAAPAGFQVIWSGVGPASPTAMTIDKNSCNSGGGPTDPCGSGPNGEYVATAELLTTAPGSLTIAYRLIQDGFRTRYFGATAGTPNSITVNIVPIPEPTVAMLIGLGLIGLAAAGGRRRS